MIIFYEVLFRLLVFIHIILVITNLVAIPFLLCLTPWYISIPLTSFLIRLATVESSCPLTIMENWLRQKIGKRQINTFIGHYFMKYIYKWLKLNR